VKKYIIISLLFSVFSFQLQAKNKETDTQNNKISITVNGQKISNDGFVYIDSSSRMPRLIAEYGDNSDSKIIWKVKVIFKRRNRNDIPAFTKIVEKNNILEIHNVANEDYVGGIALIEAKDINGNKSSFTFHIRAKNPSENEVIDYIGNDPWYANAIAKHESGQQNSQHYCQFNEVGTLGSNYITNIKYTPNRSSDKIGWGIYQITLPEPTHSELWNWKRNIDKGKSIINDKKKLAQSYFKAVKRTYPDKYEPPPNYTPPGCKTNLSAIDTATIQLYNGASVLEALHNPYGKSSTYVSCWKFYPDNTPGKKWKFIPNRNEYVKRIIKTYESIQGQ